MLNNFWQGVADRYGSKRGFARYMRYRIEMMLGRFDRQRNIDLGRVERLIFICSGNICRSPFGESYARAKGLEAASFGLHCPDGDPADPRAISFAGSQGLDLSTHLTRNISGYEPAENDLILVMEPRHLDELGELARQKQWPQRLQYSILPLFRSRPSAYLHDPYNTSPAFFDLCERQVMEAVDGIAGRMRGG
jgi:protein-tyrosine-phosphatase